jgi:hypothetical protein
LLAEDKKEWPTIEAGLMRDVHFTRGGLRPALDFSYVISLRIALQAFPNLFPACVSLKRLPKAFSL